jgi:hypothetical protein
MHIKGMVQVAGTTYRIVRRERGHYDVVRILDDERVGSFRSIPHLQVTGCTIDAEEMRDIARAAVQGGKTSWVGRPLA